MAFCLILLCGYLPFLNGQQPGDAVTERPVLRQYYTQKMNNRLQATDSQVGASEREMERTQGDKQKYNPPKKIIVPIVFNILYQAGERYPDEGQVWRQMEILQKDFSANEYRPKHKADSLEGFASRVADTEISFCIPTERGNGNGSKAGGIVFTEVQASAWGAGWDMCSSKTGGVDPWDPAGYLNVWVVNLADSVSGWATYPSLALWQKSKDQPLQYDGIVIDFDFFGLDSLSGGTAKAPYNQGKTLTHLIGNYLGLYDLWDENALCGDDYVDDTPIHNAPNYGCETYKHVSTCHEQPAEMIMNFMDNTDDGCQRMFTLGQKLRMQGMFAEGGPRESLLATNVPCKEENLDQSIVESREDPAATEAAEKGATRLAVFPNPAKREVTLDLQYPETEHPGGQIEIMIYNAQGQLQQRLTGGLGDTRFRRQIQVDQWPAGIYMILAYTPGGITSGRMVIQE